MSIKLAFLAIIPDIYIMINLTPGESELFNLTNVQEAIAALDMVVVPSKSYRTNLAVASRVDQWLADAQKATAAVISRPRTISDMWLTPIVDPSTFKNGNCPF